MMIPRHEYVSGGWPMLKPPPSICLRNARLPFVLWHGHFIRIKIHGDQGTQLILNNLLGMYPLHYLASRIPALFFQERRCVEACSNQELCNTRIQPHIIIYTIWKIGWKMVGCLMLLAISCFNVETVRELDFYPVRGGNGILPARQLLLSDADILWWQKKRKRCWKNVAGRLGTNVLIMTTRIYMFCSGLKGLFSMLIALNWSFLSIPVIAWPAIWKSQDRTGDEQ